VITVIDSGTYNYDSTPQNLVLDKICTSGNEIVIQAKEGETPTIERTLTDWVFLIHITGDYHILRGFHIGELGDGNGIEISGNHNIIENNIFDDIDTEHMLDGSQGEGIRINGGNYNIIKNNIFYDVAHSAITIENSGSYNQILNNTINNNYGHGISLLTSGVTYNLVDGNIIHIGSLSSANHQKSAIQVSGASHNSFRRNVIYDIYTRAVELSTYGAVGNTATDNWFYNNVFYNITTRPDETGNNAWVEISANYGGVNDISNNVFINNIADRVAQQTCSEYATNHIRSAWILGYFYENDAGDSESELINNDWNGNILKNNVIRVYHDGSYDLSAPQAIYYMYTTSGGGHDDLYYSVEGVNGIGSMSGNRVDDCKFVDPENHDFHLQADSPCIDAGIVVNDPNAAIGGWEQLSYNGDAPNIGAYEYP